MRTCFGTREDNFDLSRYLRELSRSQWGDGEEWKVDFIAGCGAREL